MTPSLTLMFLVFEQEAAWGSSFRAIHHIFEKSRGGVTDVGGGLLTALTAVRDGGLSEQEMTWPPLWDTSPPRQQPPLLWASWVTTGAHRGQRSNIRAAGGEKICWSRRQELGLDGAVSPRQNKTEQKSPLRPLEGLWVSKSRCEPHHCSYIYLIQHDSPLYVTLWLRAIPVTELPNRKLIKPVIC